jgi:hypothetical protein
MSAQSVRGPDAEVIALCARHVANHAAYNAYAGPEDAHEKMLWAEYLRTLDAVTDAHPQTVEGIAAKALAAKAEAASPDGSEDPECCRAATWAWQITNDLLRLAEEMPA